MNNSHKGFLIFFLITELFLVINDPYAFLWILPLPELTVSASLYLIFLIIAIVASKRSKKKLPGQVVALFLITGFVWSVFSIIHSDSSYFTRIFLLFVTYLFLMYLYQSKSFYTFWIYNNRFILIQTFLSLVGFVLVGVGILQPITSVLIGDKYVNYFGFCFSKTYIGNLIRPSGFFDEPGALAAWAMFAIVFNYAFIKDKIINRLLPYFTIVTLSLAYFAQIFIYLILKNIRHVYRLAPIALVVIVAIMFINDTKGTDFDIYEKTIGRLEYDTETGISGNSRQYSLENSRKLFLSSPLVGIGSANFGKQFTGDRDSGVSDNPYEILAKDGIIGYIISYLPLIMILFINRRKEVLVCLIVLVVGYQQRPLHINFMHDMYIWSFLLFAILDAKRNKLEHKNILKI